MTTTMASVAVAEPSDLQLVADALAEPARFALIYERFRLPVYRYLRARGADEDEALDLTASTFERALRALGGYRERGGGLGAWLFRIARNAFLDERRRAPRWTGITPAAERVADPADGPGAVELRLVLAQLPATTRDAIALRYAAGLTSREIGHVLGKRPEAIQKLIERGLDTLREALHDHA